MRHTYNGQWSCFFGYGEIKFWTGASLRGLDLRAASMTFGRKSHTLGLSDIELAEVNGLSFPIKIEYMLSSYCIRSSRVILFLMMACTCLVAQTPDLSSLESLSARSIGPAGMSGRVTCIAVHPHDDKVIYIGAASGGVWHSSDGGVSWDPIFDDQATQSIGAIAIHPLNPDLIWVGTGEGNPRNSHNSGRGVYRSLDAGKSWEPMGLEDTKTIHRILLDPHDRDVVYIAALGSAWGPSKDRGVYKSIDGGETWTQSLYVNENTGIADMVMDPDNPSKIIAATWEHRRRPWTFTSGGPGSGLHMTVDGGKSWKEITADDGLPKGELGRIGLAIAPSDPDRVYALVEAKKNDLYRSDDGGYSWRAMKSTGDKGNRPFYYADIYVDPSNENRIYSIHSVITMSEDGGKSFRNLVPWQEVHPDHHALWINPADPHHMINGNDGGMAISYNRGEDWRFVENLPLGQFYHVNHDMAVPYNIYGGMQDNGSWVGPSSIWKAGGIRNSDWRELYFGDGFDVVPRPDDNRYGYAMSQGGNVSYYDRETGNNRYIKPVHPDGETLRYNWNAAIAQDPYSDCGVYYGSQYVHYSDDCGMSWKIISPDLTTNDTSKQHQDVSGGLTIDATQAENHTTILCIAPSAVEQDLLWVGTDDGKLQLTENGGDSWVEVQGRLPGFPQGGWVAHIELSREDANVAYVSVNNYRNNDWTAYAWMTSDRGATWRRIADDRQIDGHVFCVVQDPVESNLLFLGSDVGLYISTDRGRNWQKYTHGLPSVNVTDLKIHPREPDLIIGTFGRAFYVLDNIRPLRELAGSYASKNIKIYQPADAYITSRRSVDGIRFIASSYFTGENKGPWARIPIWLSPKSEQDDENMSDPKAEESHINMTKKDKKRKSRKNPQGKAGEMMGKMSKDEAREAKDKKKPEPTRLYIMDGSDTIRTLGPKLEEGLQFVTWYLDEDGVRSPSRSAPDKDRTPSSGVRALPGNYDIVLVHKGDTLRSSVAVHMSPWSDVSIENYTAAHDAQKSYEAEVTRAAEAADQIREMKTAIDRVRTVKEAFPTEMRDSIMQRTDEVDKGIAKLEALFFTPSDFKGIDSVTRRLPSYLWTASRYLSNLDMGASGTASDAVQIAKDEIERVVTQVEQYEQSEWSAYREFIKLQDLSLFNTDQ